MNSPIRSSIIVAASVSLAGCAFPTYDPTTLHGIKADAEILLREPVKDKIGDVPRNRWPPTIASLNPESVWVNDRGVTISTKPYFDGGWGYFVPRTGAEKPRPSHYRDLGNGVYWYTPL